MSAVDTTPPPSPLDVPGAPEKRREWIKYQLRYRGSSLSDLARELGVTRYTTRSALVRPYPRMEKAIAAKIGLRPDQIWPERYDACGRPARPMGRPKKSAHKDTTKPIGSNVQPAAEHRQGPAERRIGPKERRSA